MPIHHMPEIGCSHKIVHCLMECLIGASERCVFAESGKKNLLSDQAAQPLDGCRIGFHRQVTYDLQLDRPAQELSLPCLFEIDRADDRGVLRKYFDKPFLLQAHQRVADRC
jgi:hypothetical protein